MRVVVTGAAGFIGSRTAMVLLEAGHDLVAVDSLDPYYSSELKRDRMQLLNSAGATTLVADLLDLDLVPIVRSADAILHLAGMPGVRKSWEAFDSYYRANVQTTHRILQVMRSIDTPPRMVLASSSSVYGDQRTYPTALESPTNPNSPYGVTKLAAEHLSTAYGKNFGLPTIALRYFTVYGPGQRPDMAFFRLSEAALGRGEFVLMGDGTQVRDFTYVDDVAAANVLALENPVAPGTVLNVGGGSPVSMSEVIDFVRKRYRSLVVTQAPTAPGDVRRTGADTSKTSELLGWRPATHWTDGLESQLAFHADLEV